MKLNYKLSAKIFSSLATFFLSCHSYSYASSGASSSTSSCSSWGAALDSPVIASSEFPDDKTSGGNASLNIPITSQPCVPNLLTLNDFKSQLQTASDQGSKQSLINSVFNNAAVNYQFDIIEYISQSPEIEVDGSVVNQTFINHYHCERIIKMMLGNKKLRPDDKTIMKTYHITINMQRDGVRKIIAPYYEHIVYQMCKGGMCD